MTEPTSERIGLRQLLGRWSNVIKERGIFLVAQQRNVVGGYAIAILMNVFLWFVWERWHSFDPIVPWLGSVILLLNSGLSLVFVRKGTIYAEALMTTAVFAQLLLILLVLRTHSILP